MIIKAIAIGLHCFLAGGMAALWYLGHISPHAIGWMCLGSVFGFLTCYGMDVSPRGDS